MQILTFKTSSCNLIIRRLKANLVLVFLFDLKRFYDILKSKSPCVLLKKIIKFNKNEIESAVENPSHSFRETNFVLQLI